MKSHKVAYGTWKSPISPIMLASNMRLTDVQWDDDNATLVWLERRDGNSFLVAKTGDDAPHDINTPDMRVGGRVGYGGGDFTVSHGYIYFSANGRMWRVAIDEGMPQAITPKFGNSASPAVSNDGTWVAFVHSNEGKDVLALVDSKGKQFPTIVAQGDDFVMQPNWHPDGTHLVYVAWNYPNMPWNGSELRLITLGQNGAGMPYAEAETTLVGDEDTAIFQPIFSPDGTKIAYVSDATGFGQIYLYDIATGEHTRITHDEAEHGLPAWIQGMRTMSWSNDGTQLTYTRSEQAFYSVWRYDLTSHTHSRLSVFDDYTHVEQVTVAQDGTKVALLGSASQIPTRLLVAELPQNNIDDATLRIVRRATSERLPSEALAQAEAIIWQSDEGEDVHGLYYAPTNPRYHADGMPPLMILVHGGPTSQRPARFDAEVQFFTSRGYAVLQINHRGSTGYGKAYMNKHEGTWGIVDVQDCITGARYLAEQGRADKAKIVIMGGSAGGYTVLQSLTDYPGFFKAGVCSYGVANQFSLVMDTHKFEARYNDWLVGVLPDDADIYRERSPQFKASNIRDAIIVFQGEDDPVVPKNQSDAIVNVLKRQGVPHEYHVYAGEGHGWRKPETVIDFYEKIERFLLTQVIYV
jgi:dipeptidyl aminopeptidase/acylaminoacyl peptidase